MLPDKLSFVDIETTGTSARFGRIIEIGILRVENNEIINTYHTLINPESHLPTEIEMITGITAKDLEDKPTFREIKNDILEMLVDTVFVAHNVRFDYSFLKYEFKRENIDFKLRHLCTVKLSRHLFPSFKRHNLDSIIERFDLMCENRHRAFDDAKIIWEFYNKTASLFPLDKFTNAVNIALRRPNIPIKLSEKDLDDLPEQPGVYIFYSDTGMPLYVGKSIDIKDRVLSHFSADLENFREMNIAQQVASIETITTAGELGALLLESSLIKSLLPLYNRMLRNKRELTALTTVVTNDGYNTIRMDTMGEISSNHLDSFLGFFKSKKEAKTFLANIAKEYRLCEKLLGLESAAQRNKSACFGYRLGKCSGACINKEQPLFYNLRFTTAFYKTKIKPWPFEGPIIVQEKNELTNQSENFLIDKWCYLGKIKAQDEDSVYKFAALDLCTSEPGYVFDYDMYKTIVRFLNKPENLNKVKILKGYEKIALQKTQIIS